MKKIPFVKYTLHGNKFTITDEISKKILTESEKKDFAFRATNIYYGIGSDNFLLMQSCRPDILQEINGYHHYWKSLPDAAGSDYIFRMYEPDGKEAFCCGNGLLCIADYLFRQYGIVSARIMTEIPTRRPRILALGKDMRKNESWTELGVPGKIPAGLIHPRVLHDYDDQTEMIRNFHIQFSGSIFSRLTSLTGLYLSGFLVFSGEPHFVIFTDADHFPDELAEILFHSNDENEKETGTRLVQQIGMAFNRDLSADFPEGLNINFVRIHKDSEIIEYRCFERGIRRETHACGTGAVAASFIARHLRLIRKETITVWPFLSRLYHPDAQLRVMEKENKYTLYGNPVLLFEGIFYA